MQLNRTEEAERVLREGFRLHPEDSEVMWLLSSVLMSRSSDSEAETLLQKLRRLHPNSYLAYLGLVELFVRRGLPKEALECADRAEERIAPDEFGKMYELGSLLAYLPETRQRAAVVLERSARGWPQFALAQALLGILLDGKDEAKSREYLKKAKSYWDSSGSFEDFVEDMRKHLRDGLWEADQGDRLP